MVSLPGPSKLPQELSGKLLSGKWLGGKHESGETSLEARVVAPKWGDVGLD